MEKAVIKASDVSQFVYCPVAWFLARKGYTPDLTLINIGIKRHIDLGDQIDSIYKAERRTKLISITGYLLIGIAIILIASWLLCL